MRILAVNKYLYRRGGAESYLLDLTDLQRRRGDVVELFGMRHPEDSAPHPLSDTFPSYVELDPAPDGLRGLAAAGRMVWSVASARGMARALARVQPDVVHLHNVYHQLSPSILGPVRRAGVPCVMTLHDYKLACPSYQMLDHGELCDACVTGGTWHAAQRRCKGGSLAASSLLALESGLHRLTGAYRGVDLFLSPSSFLAGVMRRAGVFPDRLRVVPHFAEVSPVRPDPERRSGFLFAGRLSREKGVDVLIDAMGALPETARLSVAGDGPERVALERQAAAVAPGRVAFLGRLPKPDLQDLLQGSLASVLPARWNENQPMTVLEALGAGVPVVCTDLGGLPELVSHGVDGLVVPPDDPAALAAALVALSTDPVRAARMGAAGRVKVERELSPQAHLERLDAAYAEAAERRGRRPSLGRVPA